MLVDRLAAFEPAVARTTEHHRHCDAGARASRELLLTVVDRLATEPELRFGARVLRARIARPLAELADSPPLK
jgi:hypothetical protein